MPSATEPGCDLCDSIHQSGTIKKRLIVCCDGTFTASNTGRETNPSNISLLSRTIANVGIDPNDPQHEKMPQVVFYQSGVGTGPMSLATKVMQGENSIDPGSNQNQTDSIKGGFGGGLNEKVIEAYTLCVPQRSRLEISWLICSQPCQQLRSQRRNLPVRLLSWRLYRSVTGRLHLSSRPPCTRHDGLLRRDLQRIQEAWRCQVI